MHLEDMYCVLNWHNVFYFVFIYSTLMYFNYVASILYIQN
jgi:hypothetical protein